MSNLISCLDCNKQISKQAISCPNCGRPIKKTQTEQLANAISISSTIVGGFILFVIASLFISYLFLPNTNININSDEQFEIIDYFKSDKEPSISVPLFKENILYLGIKNKEKTENILATHSCKKLQQKGYDLTNVIVKIFDVDKWYSDGELITLGEKRCID